jgi:hypothetical protein
MTGRTGPGAADLPISILLQIHLIFTAHSPRLCIMYGKASGKAHFVKPHSRKGGRRPSEAKQIGKKAWSDWRGTMSKNDILRKGSLNDAQHEIRPTSKEHKLTRKTSPALGPTGLAGQTPFDPQSQRHSVLMSQATQEHSANVAIQLQQTYGNRYVQRLVQSLNVQARLTVGAVDDPCETEADHVADGVAKKMTVPLSRLVSSTSQRKALGDETIEEGGQAEAVMTEQQVQRDVYEEEEEPEAEPAAGGGVIVDEGESTPQPGETRKNEFLHENISEEEPLSTKPLLQRQFTNDVPEVGADTECKISSAIGGGQSLDDSIRKSMGKAIGADFAGVKVHNDENAGFLNQTLQARAFTRGRDIFFGKGEYNPDSPEGQRLIAHELAHVVQQGECQGIGQKNPDQP